jgi:hypothetical protein
MSSILSVFCSLLLSACFVAASAPKQKIKTHKTPPKTQAEAQPESAPAPPQPPPPPPTPEHGPSSPPEVSFQAGKLTIVARNSTMGDVLTAVKQKTGAAVEMPTVSSERVVGQFGPGAPRDVLAQLLNGSHYDYVLLGSPADPGALKKIVLMARANGPEQNPSQPAPQGQRSNNNQELQAVPEVETESQPEENAVEAPTEEPQAPEEEAQPEQGQQGQPGQPVVKTPEQLLRELQQQQQQQQQQQEQQQQNAPPPGPPGQPQQ